MRRSLPPEDHETCLSPLGQQISKCSEGQVAERGGKLRFLRFLMLVKGTQR